MKDTNLNQVLEKNVAKHPKKKALIDRKGNLTYHELQEKANSIARTLLDLGVKKEDKIGILLRNSSEYVLAYLAATKIGAVAVPINFLLKPEEIKYILDDSETVLLVTNTTLGEPIRSLKNSLPKLKNFVYVDIPKSEQGIISFQEMFSNSVTLPHISVDEEDLASIIYTSGTTGKPKGVMLSHGNFLANVRSCEKAIELKEDDHILCLLPMFHSFAWTVCVLLPLHSGLTTVIAESIRPFSRVMQMIYKHKVTIFVAVPPIYSALTRLPFFVRYLSPVRLCVSGAAALPVEVLDSFNKKFRIPLLEGYGLTEASPVISFNPMHKPKAGSVGLPVHEVEIKIIDENGKDLPLGEVGELCARGKNVMKGYHRCPEDTEQVFLSGGWLRTGDIAKVDHEGYIYILDRKKDIIIVKGLNICSPEIENVILRHPALAEVAVIGIPDETGDEIIKAYCVLKEKVHRNHEVIKKEIFHTCREKLAFYKMPKEIIFCTELPKTPLGKIAKKKLRELAKEK